MFSSTEFCALSRKISVRRKVSVTSTSFAISAFIEESFFNENVSVTSHICNRLLHNKTLHPSSNISPLVFFTGALGKTQDVDLVQV